MRPYASGRAAAPPRRDRYLRPAAVRSVAVVASASICDADHSDKRQPAMTHEG